MRVACVVVAAVVVGCYQPSPPEGAPCGQAGECPSPLACQRGVCVRTPFDAEAVDQQIFDAPIDSKDEPRDVALDAPIDAAQPVMTYGPGSHTFVVPAGCPMIHVRGWGGGGGGGGDGGSNAQKGTPGDDTTFTLFGTARGGDGGDHGNPGSTYNGGAGGTATGGTINLDGESGSVGDPLQNVSPSGKGGDAPQGGIGGAPITTANTDGAPGTAPGGGGSGAQGQFSPAAGGGAGGYAERTIAVNMGVQIQFTVGRGGPGGAGQMRGGSGGDGRVTIQCQ